jgi:hypothetical protein
MPTLKNPRHERFAQLRASGKSGSEAYRIIFGKDARNADVHADQLMKMPGVRERIEELKTEAVDKCSLSREAYIKSLVEMYEAKPSEASMDNPRCDVVVVRGQKQAVFPPKLHVGAQLAKMVNWEGSIKVELEAGENLASFLGRLFVGGSSLGSRQDGKCVYGVFRRGARAVGERFGVAGEILSGDEMATKMGRALGQPVKFADVPFDVWRGLGFPGAEDIGNMFEF